MRGQGYQPKNRLTVHTSPNTHRVRDAVVHGAEQRQELLYGIKTPTCLIQHYYTTVVAQEENQYTKRVRWCGGLPVPSDLLPLQLAHDHLGQQLELAEGTLAQPAPSIPFHFKTQGGKSQAQREKRLRPWEVWAVGGRRGGVGDRGDTGCVTTIVLQRFLCRTLTQQGETTVTVPLTSRPSRRGVAQVVPKQQQQ